LIHDAGYVDIHTQYKWKYCGYPVLTIQFFYLYSIFPLLTVMEKTLILVSNYCNNINIYFTGYFPKKVG